MIVVYYSFVSESLLFTYEFQYIDPWFQQRDNVIRILEVTDP